jgi:hypothetical protein
MVAYVTAALTSALNRLIDERPQRRAALKQEQATISRRIANLVALLEDGRAEPAILETLRRRESERQQLDVELASFDEPLDEKLVAAPMWVRSQLSDLARLLNDAPERARAEFRRLSVAFQIHPVHDEGSRPFLRAVGSGEFEPLVFSTHLSRAAVDRTDPLRAP